MGHQSETEVATLEQAIAVMTDDFAARVDSPGGEGRFARFMIEAMPGVLRAQHSDLTKLFAESKKVKDGDTTFAEMTDETLAESAAIVGNFIGNVVVNAAMRYWSCDCQSCSHNRQEFSRIAYLVMQETVDSAEGKNDKADRIFGIAIDAKKKQN